MGRSRLSLYVSHQVSGGAGVSSSSKGHRPDGVILLEPVIDVVATVRLRDLLTVRFVDDEGLVAARLVTVIGHRLLHARSDVEAHVPTTPCSTAASGVPSTPSLRADSTCASNCRFSTRKRSSSMLTATNSLRIARKVGSIGYAQYG